MKRSLLGRVALALTLIIGVAGSALSYDAEDNSVAGLNQLINLFDITAVIFEPSQSDAIGAILRDLHLTSLANDASGNGQYVLDAASATDVFGVLQKYGKVERQLHQQGPLGGDGRASAFSMWPDGQFSVSLKTLYIPPVKQFSDSLKTRYLPFVKKLPPSFIMDYSLKASFKRPVSIRGLEGVAKVDDIIRLHFASGGSVLLPDKGTFMSIREMENGFLIWIISAD